MARAPLICVEKNRQVMDRANFAEPRRAQLFTQRVARRTTSGARLGSRVCAPFKRCLRNSIDGQVRAVVKTESQLVVKLRCPFFKEGLPLWGTSLEGRVDPDLQRRADHRVWIRRWWNPLALVGSDRANYETLGGSFALGYHWIPQEFLFLAMCINRWGAAVISGIGARE
ncbi:hypothetical protein ACJJTC_001476 [Scirpophaga incertulas]